MEYSYHLSCIVPVYNAEQYLEKCIGSLLQITSISVEIILIDDGSTDSSPILLDKYAESNPNIKVIHQNNKGVAVARNTGIDIATGEYIAFIDSDDWVVPQELTRLYNCAQHNNADMILGNILYISPEDYTYSPFLPLPKSVTEYPLSGKKCAIELLRYNKMVPMATSYLYRRQWINQYHFYFKSILHEDELWTIQTMCLAEKIICTEWTFYHYNQREGSIMHTLDTGKRINSLTYIANQTLTFANQLIQKEDHLLWSWLLLRVAKLYNWAFSLLEKKHDTRFQLINHSLYQLYFSKKQLAKEVLTEYVFHYKKARIKLKNYHNWRISSEVTDMPADISKQSTLILFYNKMWEIPLTYPKEQIPKDTLITSDQKYLDQADVVVFHLPTLKADLDMDIIKAPHQKWVGWTMECEENYPYIKSTEFMSLFDYWMSYHQGADVIMPYYESNYPDRLKQNSPISFSAKKDICMMISSPFNQSGRQEYLKDLMNAITIDSYGKLYNNCQLKEDHGHSSKMELYKRYKFVIAFENSCALDYVTEKFFDPLLAGAVPIYLGAPNIEEYLPGKDCYINVRDFKSPKDLAEHLKACCEDPALYGKYQAWRKRPICPAFIEKALVQQIHPIIRLCHLVKKNKGIPYNPINKEGKFVLCSFGDSRYKKSKYRLQEQAEDFECFDSIYLYDESDLSESFKHDFQDHLRAGIRGFGYWVWKPRIILDTLSKMENGDVLLYVDMGCHLNSKGFKKLNSYWEEVKYNKSGFLVTQLEAHRKECFWTKGDVLDYFHIRGSKDAFSAQYQAGVIFIRKESQTIRFVQKWLDVYYKDFHLVDDSPSISSNEEGFIEHRHDQSILSILLKKHGTSTIPLEDIYRPYWDLSTRFYPILLKRDLK